MGRSRKPLWSFGPPWVRIPPSPLQVTVRLSRAVGNYLDPPFAPSQIGMSNRAYPAPPNPSDEPTAWRRLVDGRQLNGWTPRPESGPFLAEDSVLRCAGPEGTLALRGDTDLGARRDLEFVLNARASGPARLSLWLPAPRHGESRASVRLSHPHQQPWQRPVSEPGAVPDGQPSWCSQRLQAHCPQWPSLQAWRTDCRRADPSLDRPNAGGGL